MDRGRKRGERRAQERKREKRNQVILEEKRGIKVHYLVGQDVKFEFYSKSSGKLRIFSGGE